jgi:CBS domain-containing protein
MYLLLNVLDFLDMQPKKPFTVALQNYKSRHPITTRADMTFEYVVMKMTASRIHRLWIVDDENKVIGVISVGDIFKVFLPWANVK